VRKTGLFRKEAVFHGRVAAHRGIWIGGTRHFDDFFLPNLDGACVLLTFDPAGNRWQVFPGAGQSVFVPSQASQASGDFRRLPACGFSKIYARFGVKVDDDDGSLKAGSGDQQCRPMAAGDHHWRRVTADGAALNRCGETVVSVARPQGREDVVLRLEPKFISRRWNEEAAAEAMPAEVVCPLKAVGMRETLVLVKLSSEYDPEPPACVRFESDSFLPQCHSHLVAVVHEASLGRSESSTVRFPKIFSVSRSHCVLSLRSEQHQEDPEAGASSLAVYDDGSLGGTTLNRIALGVGRSSASPLNEGDVLRLGSELSVKVEFVSNVLSLHDHTELAEFFDRMGERRTATSLREEPRLSERIVSDSLGEQELSLYRPPPRPIRSLRSRLTAGRSSSSSDVMR
jgi:pSer/pThr/pTyr-binding forkhead associated (FHA) protein